MKSLAELQKAFDENETRGGSSTSKYYPHWKLDYGQQAVIRFLPDKNEDNGLDFLVKKHMHTLEINGEEKKVPCLKMYGEDCPICKVSNKFYNQDDKVNGKKYWRKETYIAQALIITDPINHDNPEDSYEGKVCPVSVGYQLYGVLSETFKSGELDEVPYAYKGGCNFIIKKTKQGDYANYSVGSSFSRKATDLTKDQLAFVQNEMVDLSTLLPEKPSVEKVETMLQAALTGAQYTEDDGTPSIEQTAAADTSVSTDSDFESEDFEDEADEILNAIRKRTGK